MKTIHVCKYCGSPRVFIDVIYNIDRGTYDTYDDVSCENCGADSHDLTVKVEVLNSFDVENDMFDLETLK